MSVSARLRVTRLTFLLLLVCLIAVASPSRAAVGFRIPVTDSTGSNPFTRTITRGISYFGKCAMIDLAGSQRTTTMAMDSTFSTVTFVVKVGTEPIAEPAALAYATYEAQRLKTDVQSELVKKFLASYKSTAAKAGAGEGVAIDLPYRIKSKTFRRLFGGDNVGVRVQGNVSINGSLRQQKFDELQQANMQNSNTSFRIDMVQQFTITGKIGQKVEVKVDQNSERLFDFENSLKLTYTGEEDEIVQKVEAGNVNLNLGTRLATFSGKNTGLFGLKTEAKVGNLRLTGIASLERGQKNRQSPNQSTSRAQFDEKSFIKYQYFWVSAQDVVYLDAAHNQPKTIGNYRENYRHFSNRIHQLLPDQQLALADVDVFVSARQTPGGDQVRFGRAAALQFYADLARTDTFQQDGNHQSQTWKALRKGTDYTVDLNLGYIRLTQPVQAGDMVACAFATMSHDTFGTLLSARSDTAANLRLVLLKSNDPSPTDSSWNLMFRHVYSLQATFLDKNNFKLAISRAVAQNGGREETSPPGYNETYLTFFGFDQTGPGGTPGADLFIDDGTSIINWDLGELHFLDLTPFSPTGIYENGNLDTVGNLWVLGPSDTAGFRAPYLYSLKPTQYADKSLWRMETEFKGSSSVFDLGPLVLEGSEEVLLNGQKLVKNADYTIDYSSGQLRILNEAAKARGANLEITYESGKVFQLDKTTLLGARAEYGLWEDSYIGGMLLYLDQQTLDKRVRLGSEPIRNTLWDMNTSLHFKPGFLTTAMDALPLVQSSAASQIDVDAEIAHVVPNPNSLENRATGDLNGVAYLDDFEGSRRATPLGLMRRTWAVASYPTDERIDRHRGRFRWWNPTTRSQVLVKDVFPNRDVNSSVANTLQSLWMEFTPDSSTGHPEESWGGVMRYLGEGYSDQSRSQYLEFWVQLADVEQNGPKLVVDLGTLSEDAIPNDTLDTEDNPLPGVNCGPRQECGNGVLEPVEDRGLDHTSGSDPNDMAFWNGHGRDKYGNELGPVPSNDDWHYDAGSETFDHINGTENNRNDESGGYPDTEDLNGNDILDQTESYYSYTIDLSEHSPYIVGDNRAKQWYLYRIPLKTDDPLVRRRVGNADLTSVRWARLYLSGVQHYCKIQLVQMDIVANEWLPVTSATDTTEYITAAVINTHENPGYHSPPGVAGERDPITGVVLREQSLVLKINQLDSLTATPAPQQFFLAKNLYQETNLTEYRHIKMFVHGGDTLEGSRFSDDKYQIILRLGQSYSLLNDNYYEIIKTVKPGWHPDNVIDVLANDLSQLHVLRGTRTGRFALATDTLYHPEDSLAIQGNPTLAQVGFVAVGVRLTNKHKHGEGDEIWVDELRLTDIYKDPGTASQVSAHVALSDVASVTGNYQVTDASFHNVNERINALRSSNDTWQGNVSFNAHKFYLERFGFRLPVNMSFNQSVTTPNILPGTDTRVNASQAPDSVKSKANTFSCQAQYSKGAGSKNPFVQWTLEKLTAGWSYSHDRRSDYNTEISRTDQTDVQAAYSFPTSKGDGLAFLWFLSHAPVVSSLGDTRFFYKPTKLTVSAQASKRTAYSATRPVYSLQYAGTDSAYQQITRNITAPPRAFNTTRALNVGFQFFEPLTIDFTRTHKARLDRGDWMNLLSYDFGQLTDINQSLQNNYAPQLLPWLKPTFSYATGYSWTNPNFTANNTQAIGNTSNFGTDVTLDFRSILGPGSGGSKHATHPRSSGKDESFKPPEEMPGALPGHDERQPGQAGTSAAGTEPAGKEPPGRTPPGTEPPSRRPGHERDEKPAEVPPAGKEQPADTTKPAATPPAQKPSRSPFSGLGSLLSPIRTVLTTIDPVALTYDNNTSHNETGTMGQANLKYQFGLSQNPSIPIAPNLTSLPSLRRGQDITARSGLRVTQDVRFAFNYAHRQSSTISGTSTGSTEKNVFWLANKGKVTPYPFVDVTLDWSGLERISFLSKVARTVSLSSGLSSKMAQNWANSTSNITSTTYTRAWNPLLGVNFSWKRDIESQVRYNSTSTFTDTQIGGKQRQGDAQFTGQVSYTFRTGFKLPVPLIGKLRLQNQTTFSLNADYRSSKQEQSSSGNPNQFAVNGATSSWSIQPRMTYSFSSAVQGQASLQYQQTKNEITGSKQRLFEFGVQVNIAIRG